MARRNANRLILAKMAKRKRSTAAAQGGNNRTASNVTAAARRRNARLKSRGRGRARRQPAARRNVGDADSSENVVIVDEGATSEDLHEPGTSRPAEARTTSDHDEVGCSHWTSAGNRPESADSQNGAAAVTILRKKRRFRSPGTEGDADSGTDADEDLPVQSGSSGDKSAIRRPAVTSRVGGGGGGGGVHTSWTRTLWSKLFYDAHERVLPPGTFAEQQPHRQTGGDGGGIVGRPVQVPDGTAASWSRLAQSDPPAFEVDTWRTADDVWSVRLQWTTAAGPGGTKYEVYARRVRAEDMTATAAAVRDEWRYLSRVDTRWPSVSLHVDGFPAGYAYHLCVRRVGRTEPLGVVRTEILQPLF